MNINHKQVLAIIIAILGVLMVSTTQLTDIIGAGPTKIVVSIAGLLNSVLASVMAIVSTQTGLVRDVQAMPGVESIVVNKDANPTLASLAVHNDDPKVEVKPSDAAAVTQTANKA